MEINKVKHFRKVGEFSIRELSVVSGISTATIVAIERYGYLPGPDVRAKLVKVLGVSEAVIWPNLEVVNNGKQK
jgi:DNA-binding XRE family transcriptional regulator